MIIAAQSWREEKEMHMRLVFAGTPEPAVVALEQLIAAPDIDVVAVLTRPDAKRGRGRSLYPSPVAECAQRHGIEVIKTSSLTAGAPGADDARRRLTDLAPDCIPVVAFGALIPADLLDLPAHGFVNLHFSLLPRWRGAAPVQAAIAAGDDTTGVTVFRIDEGLDTGRVIATKPHPIDDSMTAGQLLEQLADDGAGVLVDAMRALAGGHARLVEQTGDATYAPKISSADAKIMFDDDADVIVRRIRAVTPAPGAWCVAEQARLKIGAAVAVDRDTSAAPGTVDIADGSMFVAAGDGRWLRVDEIQPPGKKMMAAADYCRGARGIDGMVLA